MCCTPASVCMVVESLSGGRHLLTPASSQVLPAEPHLCLQSAGGSHIPAQPCAALSHLTLSQGHGHVALHSFQRIWQNKHCYVVKSLQINLALRLNSVYLLLPCWFLKGQDSVRSGFPFHQTCKQRFLNFLFPRKCFFFLSVTIKMSAGYLEAQAWYNKVWWNDHFCLAFGLQR